MAEDDVHRVELRAKSIDELRTFLDGTDVDLGCRPVVRKSRRRVRRRSVHAPSYGRTASQRAECPGDYHERSSRTRRRSAAPGRPKSARATGSLRALRRAVSGSRNSAMAYMNVEEIEAALEALATSHPGVTELILLPNRTSEGRQSTRCGSARPTRWWRTPSPSQVDCMHANGFHLTRSSISQPTCSKRIPEAPGLRYGGQRFSADDIRSVVEGLQLVLFPCVNPDGRHHSQTAEPMWRKNRRRAAAGSQCVGVDINRNFDALWDFRRHFAPDSHVSASDDPCDPQVYVGPAAASEAETRNVVSLLDRYPRMRWFVDLHGYVPAIFYNWGFDTNQSSNPTMNFLNPAFDGQRGRGGDAYGEFIPAGDLQTLQKLGATVNRGDLRRERDRLRPRTIVQPVSDVGGER